MRYKFRYSNSIYKSAARIAAPMQNFFMIIAIFFVAYNLIGRLCIFFNVSSLTIKNFGEILQEPMFICAFLSAIIYCFLPKGVFINDSEIVIAKYTFVPFNFKMRIHIPYNEIEDREKLELWKSKAKTSKYYQNAIDTWTIRDVNKRKVANQNNLRLLEFFSYNDFLEWFNMC